MPDAFGPDDLGEDQPYNLREAAALCHLTVATFNRRLRPLLKERERRIGRQPTFLRRDLRQAYRRIFAVDVDTPPGQAPLPPLPEEPPLGLSMADVINQHRRAEVRAKRLRRGGR